MTIRLASVVLLLTLLAARTAFAQGGSLVFYENGSPNMSSVARPGGLELNGEYDPSYMRILGMTFSISFCDTAGQCASLPGDLVRLDANKTTIGPPDLRTGKARLLPAMLTRCPSARPPIRT